MPIKIHPKPDEPSKPPAAPPVVVSPPPVVVSPPPVSPPPITPAATARSPYRELGNTTRQAFNDTICGRKYNGATSPLCAEIDAIYDALAAKGVSRLAVPMSFMECQHSTYPTCGVPKNARNPWSVTGAGDAGQTGRWAKYSSYAAAAKAWADHITNGTPYAGASSIAEFIHVYAPSSDGNDEARYVQVIVDGVNALPLSEGQPAPSRKMVRFAGTSVDVPLDAPFRIDLIPLGQTNQRPGIHMEPEKFVVHETDNFAVGANAEMHRRYFRNGAEGRQASVHLIVDADELIQILPFNEVAWHGGDGAGTCNYSGIAMEICVDSNNARKDETRANAEQATAAALMAINSSVLQQHSKCCSDVGNPSGCHTLCPRTIRDEGYWPTYVSHVNAMLAGTSPAPIVVYPSPVLVPVFDGTDKRLGATTARAVQRQFVAKQDGVKVHMYADPGSQEIRAPLKKGETLTSWYLVPGEDGKDWIVTNHSARVPMDGLSPTVSVK